MFFLKKNYFRNFKITERTRCEKYLHLKKYSNPIFFAIGIFYYFQKTSTHCFVEMKIIRGFLKDIKSVKRYRKITEKSIFKHITYKYNRS